MTGMQWSRRRLVPAFVVVMALGLGACGGGSGASVASFCTLVKKDHTAFSTVTKSNLKAAGAAMKDLVSKSPAIIKADVRVLNAYYDDLTSGDQAAAVAESAQATTASTNFVSYVQDNCKIVLTPST